MVVYKAFGKGLVCRGHQFNMGENYTDKANCVANGFHAAENPIDCFRYYHPGAGKEDEYYLCEAKGDIDEDGRDTKISCTCLDIVKRLSLYEMAAAALLYIKKHPGRRFESFETEMVKVTDNEASVRLPGIAIARGEYPKASGVVGTALGWILTDSSDRVISIRLAMVDGKDILPDRYYTLTKGGELCEAQGYR